MSRFADWLDKTFIPTNQERLRKAYNITCNALREVNIPFIQGEGGLFVWVDFREVRCILYAIQSSFWWGVCMCGGGRGLGAWGYGWGRSSWTLITLLCADYSILKSHNFDDVKSANNYDLKPWNVAAARPVNRSSNQPLCLTYWGPRVDLWSSG